MVIVRDNIGRPLYIESEEGRLHPYTKELVSNTFEYEHETNIMYTLCRFKLHIWRYHDEIQRTCRFCGKMELNQRIIGGNKYPPLIDNWIEIN